VGEPERTKAEGGREAVILGKKRGARARTDNEIFNYLIVKCFDFEDIISSQR
jgi:hypothetical protein